MNMENFAPGMIRAQTKSALIEEVERLHRQVAELRRSRDMLSLQLSGLRERCVLLERVIAELTLAGVVLRQETQEGGDGE